MPKYSGQQLSTINLLASEMRPALLQLHDFVFGFNDADILINEFGGLITSPAAEDQRCFKPANQTLQSDARYWTIEFNRIQDASASAQSNGELSISNANKFINVTTKFVAWCNMVSNSYLSGDIPAYHNKITYNHPMGNEIIVEFLTGLSFTERRTEIIEPTNTLNTSSEICEYFDGRALRVVQGFFRSEQGQELIEEVRQKAETINNLLNSPQPDPSSTIQPVQITQTGTSKLLKILAEIFSYVKDAFSSLNQELGEISTSSRSNGSSLHDIRAVELKQARSILQELRGEATGPVVSVQQIKQALDAQSSLFIIGSEGNYYPTNFEYFSGPVDGNGLPVDPQTGERINIVRLSISNGLIYSLRRADDNAQMRYLRVNDALYEINTGISEVKPRVEQIEEKTRTIEAKLNEVLSKISVMEIVVNSISQRI